MRFNRRAWAVFLAWQAAAQCLGPLNHGRAANDPQVLRQRAPGVAKELSRARRAAEAAGAAFWAGVGTWDDFEAALLRYVSDRAEAVRRWS